MPRKKEPTAIVETNPVETKPAVNEKPISKTSKTTAKNSKSAKTTTAATTSLPTKTIAPKVKKEPKPKVKTITRIELTQEVARAIGQYMEITNRDADMIVGEIINSMTKALKTGDEIEIRGFGAFRVRSRNPRNGRNPKTGEVVAVPSKNVVFFKMGRELKESLLKSQPNNLLVITPI